jgi:hypothetical protein
VRVVQGKAVRSSLVNVSVKMLLYPALENFNTFNTFNTFATFHNRHPVSSAACSQE